MEEEKRGDAPVASLESSAATRILPCVLVSTAVDSRDDVRAVVLAARDAITSHSAAEALVCVSIQAVLDVITPLVGGATVTAIQRRRHALDAVQRWLASLTTQRAAKQHLRQWRRTKALYSHPADLAFWQQLLSRPDVKVGAGFSMALLRFLHTEHDCIQRLCPTRAGCHQLWLHVYRSDSRLNLVILQIGRALRAAGVAVAADAPVFHKAAQRIYLEQCELERTGGEAARDDHTHAMNALDASDDDDGDDDGDATEDDGERAVEEEEEKKQPIEDEEIESRGSSDDRRKSKKPRDAHDEEDEALVPERKRSQKKRGASVHTEISSDGVEQSPPREAQQARSSATPPDAPAAAVPAAPAAAGAAAPGFTFEPRAATVPLELDRPLATCLPFHPTIMRHMAKYGVAVVKPTLSDKLGLQRAIDPRLVQYTAYRHAYRMTFGCVNESEAIEKPAQPADVDGLYAANPSERAVLEFLEAEWRHMPDSTLADPLPRNPPTEKREYLKDMSAHDAHRSNGSATPSPPSGSPPHLPFLPLFDAKLDAHLREADEQVTASGSGDSDDDEESSNEALDEDMQGRRYLRSAKQRITFLRGAYEANRKRGFLVHPLFQDEFNQHPHSLARLSQVMLDGVETTFAYLKYGFQFFNAHTEQMLFQFVHHQICGASLWIIVPHSERHKLDRVWEEIMVTRARWQARRDNKMAEVGDGGSPPVPSSHTGRTLARILFHAKNVFPPLSLLRKHGVLYYMVRLQEDQVLMAHGGFTHFGFNLVAGETISFASNLVTESWLVQGGPEFLEQHFEWVRELQRMGATRIGQQTTKLDAHMKENGISRLQLAHALNMCPPAYSCSMVRGVIADLQHFLVDPTTAVCAYTISRAEIAAAVVRLKRALRLLHEVRPFFELHYVDKTSTQFSVCTCHDASALEPAPVDEDQVDGDEIEADAMELDDAPPPPAPAATRKRKHIVMSDEDDDDAAAAVAAHEATNDDEERKDDSTSLALRPGATRCQQDARVALLDPHLRPLDANAEIASVTYMSAPTSMARCWYECILATLQSVPGMISIWSIHALLTRTVRDVRDIGTAALLGFEGARDATDSQLTRIKNAFTRSADFQSASWATDVEMHLLSYAFNGALAFLVYRTNHPHPSSIHYTGPGAVTPLVEIALHHCGARERRSSSARQSEPNHYNLLQYVVGARQRVQSFWWVRDEVDNHRKTRREFLRQAVHERA